MSDKKTSSGTIKTFAKVMFVLGVIFTVLFTIGIIVCGFAMAEQQGQSLYSVLGIIGAAIFSMTEDLTAAFPSTGVRSLPGFDMVPLFDARQCAIEGSLPRCIRVLLLIETDQGQQELCHVYQAGAAALRPDLAK